MPAMPASAHVPTTLISLRPAGEHGAMRRAAARHGLAMLAVSPWRLQARDDAITRATLAQALAAPVVVFTSPAAVRAAQALGPLAPAPGACWLAVGEGSARALRRAGVVDVVQPERMDSEGLLALPALAAAARVGLVTAPGGRGVIAAELARRGSDVVRADVYERVPLRLSPPTLRRLRALAGPTVLAISSGEALIKVLDQLPADLLARWQAQPVVAASERLAALAAERGFGRIVRAQGPRPAQLLAAAAPLP